MPMSSILHRGSSPGQSSHNRLCIIFCEPDNTTTIMSSFKVENSLIVFSNNIFALLCKITEKHHHHRRKHPHHQCIGILQVLLHLRAHDKAYFPSFCASALSNSVQLSTLCKCTHHGQSTKPPNCLSQTVYSGRWKHFVARCTLGCSRPS